MKEQSFDEKVFKLASSRSRSPQKWQVLEQARQSGQIEELINNLFELVDRNDSVSVGAISVLGQIGEAKNPRVIERLIGVVRPSTHPDYSDSTEAWSEDDDIMKSVEQAAFVLGKWQVEEAIAPLGKMLYDRTFSPKARKSAITALVSIASPKALPYLELLRDSDEVFKLNSTYSESVAVEVKDAIRNIELTSRFNRLVEAEEWDEACTLMTDWEFLGAKAREAPRPITSTGLHVENLLIGTLGKIPIEIIRKNEKLSKLYANLGVLSAGLELHYERGAGDFDPKAICKECGEVSIVHGDIDLALTSDEYNNYFSFCRNCFSSWHLEEINRWGNNDPLRNFDYETNQYIIPPKIK